MWFEVGTKPEEEWPLSKNAPFEAAPEPDEPFDYNQQPSRFYFDVESVGSLPPRQIVESGLAGLVLKLQHIRDSVQEFANVRPHLGGGTAYGAGGGTVYGGGTAYGGMGMDGGRTAYGGGANSSYGGIVG